LQNKKKIYFILIAVIILSLIIEILFAHPHYHMIWNTMPGADIIIGFCGAWLLILLAKIIIANLLQRDEDYYDKGGNSYDE